MDKEIPKRCIDPVIKYCQGCKYGHRIYPDWVETYEDTFDSGFETVCIIGCDKGEDKDKPTAKEIYEFHKWVEQIQNKKGELNGQDRSKSIRP